MRGCRFGIGAAALSLGLVVLVSPAARADNVVVVNTGSTATGVFGNDTVSSLGFRPLNNARLGPAYFGSGYPRESTSVYYPEAPQSRSGILAATSYLATSGWSAWSRERKELLARQERLQAMIAELQKKIAELEAKIAKLENEGNGGE